MPKKKKKTPLKPGLSKLKKAHRISPPPPLDLKLARQFKQTLIQNGYKGLKLEFLLTQAAYESGGFTSENALKNHNYGGLKYNKKIKRSGASKTFLAPPGESKNGSRTPYIEFKDMDDYVKKVASYAHLNEMVYDNKIGPPLEATTLDEYYDRIELNHYNQDRKHYLPGLKNYSPLIKALLQEPVTLINADPAYDALKLSYDHLPSHLSIAQRADHARIADVASVAKIKRENEERVRKDTINTKSINALPDWLNWPLLYQQQNNGNNKNTPRFLRPLPPVNNLHTNKDSGAKISVPSFTEGPSLGKMGSLSIPTGSDNPENELSRQISSYGGLSLLSDGVSRSEIKDNASIATDSGGMSVTVNLNTPMIGNFSVTTTDSAGIGDLKRQVEEVLFEVINSVNTV